MTDQTLKNILDHFKRDPLTWIAKLPAETKIIYLSDQKKCLFTGDSTEIVAFCISTISELLGDGFRDYLATILERLNRESKSAVQGEPQEEQDEVTKS